MTGGRLPGLFGLGVRRVLGRLTGPQRGRTLVSVIGVAAAIAVLVVVTGLSLGLAGSGTVASEEVDYWIVPDDGGVGTTPLAYEGASLGAVHDSAARIRADDRVDLVTPVAIQPVRLRPIAGDGSADTEGGSTTTEGGSAYVLALGIVPTASGGEIAGLDVGPLSPGDPHYANGSYDGPWTGELVVSPGASEQLGVDAGAALQVGEDGPRFTVTAVAESRAAVGAGTVPVVIGHLAELQAVTNTAADDLAAQILVGTDDAGVREFLAGIYPRTNVVQKAGFARLSGGSSRLPLAMALAAGLVALGIGVAFVATTMGLELSATRGEVAVLRAIGFGRWSLAAVLVAETVTVAVVGGAVGIGIGWLGIGALNAGVVGAFDVAGTAVFDPLLVPYGLAAAVVVAILSVGYPLLVAWRTDPLAEVGR